RLRSGVASRLPWPTPASLRPRRPVPAAVGGDAAMYPGADPSRTAAAHARLEAARQAYVASDPERGDRELMVALRLDARIKPDGVQRGLIGEILSRLERKGLKVVGLRMLQVPREMAERHYAVHIGKHFYEGLVEFITSGPVAALALEGPDAIATVRRVVGQT